MVMRLQRPARQEQVAVPALAKPHVHLVDPFQVAEVVGQKLGLIVKPRTADVPIDLLQADDIGIFGLDDGRIRPNR